MRSIIIMLLTLSIVSCHAQSGKTDLKSFTAYNAVTFEYRIFFPENKIPQDDYEFAILFSETTKSDQKWEKTIDQLEVIELESLVLIVPRVPLNNDHWKSHPIHHGLNDLIKSIRKEYKLKSQKFHFIGYESGHDVAQTYSGMSSSYVASMSIINGEYWNNNKQEWFDSVINKRVPTYIYDSDRKDITLDLSRTTFETIQSLEDALQIIDKRF